MEGGGADGTGRRGVGPGITPIPMTKNWLETMSGTLALLAFFVVLFVASTILVNAIAPKDNPVLTWTMELGKDAFIALITYLRSHDSASKVVEENAALKAEIERLKAGG